MEFYYRAVLDIDKMLRIRIFITVCRFRNMHESEIGMRMSLKNESKGYEDEFEKRA